MFDPGFKINLHIKDLATILDTSHQIGVPLPLPSFVMEIFQILRAEPKGDLDHGGVITLYERLANVEVRKIQQEKAIYVRNIFSNN